MAKKILFRAGTNAQRLAITLDNREPFWTTDTKLLYVGDGATAGGILVGPITTGSTETNPFQNGTDGSGGQITGAANTTITLTATDMFKSVKLVATGGGGIYTHNIVLATTNATPGDEVKLAITLPASTNPTLSIRNATSGGTQLHALHNDDGINSLYWSGKFTFDGSAWEFAGGGYQQP